MTLFRSRQRLILWLVVFGIAAAGLLYGASAFGVATDTFGLAPVDDTIALGNDDLRVIAARIIRVILGLLGVIALGIVLYGGFVYMTAGGNEEKVTTARKILINGAIGLAIILSAFTITQFVLKQLQGAINPAQDDDGNNDDIWKYCDQSSSDYDKEKCENECQQHPTLSYCQELEFYVRSITPSTPGSGNATDMNNITVRVLFSQPIRQDTNLATAVTLRPEEGAAALPLSAVLIENSKVIEAKYNTESKNIPPREPGKNYLIEVNKDIQSALTGDKIKTNYTSGGVSYPASAKVYVNKEYADAVKPLVSAVTIDGSAGAGNKLYIGDVYTVGSVVEDRSTAAPFGGVGLANITVTDAANGSVVFSGVEAPPVNPGSSPAYAVNYTGVVSGNKFTPLHSYVVTLTAYDIDGNSAAGTAGFTVYGAHCDNDKQDGDETGGVNVGGSCGGGSDDPCVKDSDCAFGYACIEKKCSAAPVITDVDPLSGAPGNWVTVLGKNFGASTGTVEFASDLNQNNAYDADEWVAAPIVQCENAPAWHADWAVVQVPNAANEANSAVSFDGVDDAVATKLVYSADAPAGWTAEAWYSTTDTATERMTVVGGNNGGRFEVYVSQGKPGCRVWDTQERTFFADETATGGWHHIVCVQSVAGDGSKLTSLYVDGALKKTVPYASISAGGVWHIAKPGSINAHYFKGIIDEAAVYKKPLSAEQVAAHYESRGEGAGAYAQGIIADGPAGYWRLAESSGAIALDQSQAKNNAAYAGGVTYGTVGIFGPAKKGILETSAVRVKRGDAAALSDTTVDEFGPKPVAKDDPDTKDVNEQAQYVQKYQPGLFIKNAVKRPGLCSVGAAENVDNVKIGDQTVSILKGQNSGPPGMSVRALGSGFGAAKGASGLWFGGLAGQVSGAANWSDTIVTSTVPINLKTGDVGVYLKVGGYKSNGVKFTVLSDKDSDQIPVVSGIDPASTTPKSYITIQGKGFGEMVGYVFVADTAGHALSCGSPTADGSCHTLNAANLPGQCGDTWSDTQIIAEVPEGTSAGSYRLAVKRGDALGFKSDGQAVLEVKDGPPLPSACRVEPAQFPAPLPAGSSGIFIHGVNFGSDPEVLFWRKGATANDFATWLRTDIDLINGQDAINAQGTSATQINTLIPVSAKDGLSMSTGPIRVLAKNGLVSNAVSSTVSSCVGGGDLPGYQCCSAGPDAGLWKQKDHICAGETREAGYVWRFASGIIPKLPEVVDSCNDIDPPSPTPRKKSGLANAACVNASVAVRFNIPMDAASFGAGTVRLYECGTGSDGKIDCKKAKKDVTDPGLFSYENKVLVIREYPKAPALAPSTWYHVELTNGVTSLENKSVLGQEQQLKEPLRATRSCGPGTAFCFDFKTGSEMCTLASAALNPPAHATNRLGIIEDASFPFSGDLYLWADLPDDPDHPFYYYVWGQANQECVMLNVDQYDWQWSPQAGKAGGDKARAYKYSGAPGSGYVNRRAVVEALAHTAPDAVDIKAEADIAFEEAPNFVDLLVLSGAPAGASGYTPSGAISIPDSSALNLPSSFSWHMRFKVPDSVVTMVLLNKRDTPNAGPGYNLRYTTTGAPTLCFRSLGADGATVVGLCTTNLKADKDGAYNVRLVWDKAAKKLSWFVTADGATAEESTTFNGQFPSAGPLEIVPQVQPSEAAYPVIYSLRLTEGTGGPIKKSAAHFTALSPLTISLADPDVIYYEPNCAESCVNAGIRIQFNRQMDQKKYGSAFKLYKCLDNSTSCAKTEAVDLYAIDPSPDSSPTWLSASLSGNNLLAANQYYQIVLNEAGTADGDLLKALDKANPAVYGTALPEKKLPFKTQNKATPCDPASVTVKPNPHTAKAIGERAIFSAAPYSAPNACSQYGQALSKWKYSYAWSTKNPAVAKIASDFNTAYGFQPYCTAACLPKGSDVASDSLDTTQPLCGSNVIEAGEDCEIDDQDCTLSCLFANPANHGLTGSGPVPAGQLEKDKSYCGDGFVTAGEACDIAKDKGCTANCLHAGTPLAAVWCEQSATAAQKKSAACQAALSVCGNNIIELGEECEIGLNGATASTCSPRCLVQSACSSPLKQCTAGEPGCNSDCTWSGSSLLYQPPSLCGDGQTGLGEYSSTLYKCENTPSETLGSGPTQLVEAVGQSTDAAVSELKTKVEVELNATTTILGSADYTLQCGYSEFAGPNADGAYNLCPDNAANIYGVGKNSCCRQRPQRYSERPADGAGWGGPGVCRNAYLEVTFTSPVAEETLANNLFLLHGYPTAVNCADKGGTNVDQSVMNQFLAFAPDAEPAGWWGKIWAGVKQFFVQLFGLGAGATAVTDQVKNENIVTWCANEVGITTRVKNVSTATASSTSQVGIYVKDLLAESGVYAVLLEGGHSGIADAFGVGISSPEYSGERDDVWFFKTGDDVCKLAGLAVEPPGHLFTKPKEQKQFLALTESTNEGQPIVPIPAVYDWIWSWKPAANPVFDIPVPGTPGNEDAAIIGARNVQGHINGVVEAKVTADVIAANNQLGQSFTAVFGLDAFFCEKPWPAVGWYPFQDTKYNFSLGYCADAGQTGVETDDLPYLKEPLVFLPGGAEVPKQCALESKACAVDADCDATLYQIPTLGKTVVPSGTGICWNGNNSETYPAPGQKISCHDLLDCVIDGQTTVDDDASRVVVKGGRAYVSSVAGELAIYDVTNAANIKLLGTFGSLDLFEDLAVEEPYAYLVSYSDESLQVLRVIDVSDPAKPTPVKTINFYRLYPQITPEGNDSYKKIKVGTTKGVVTIEVTNPLDPAIKIVVNYGPGEKYPPVENFALKAIQGALYIMDVSNPAAPEPLTAFASYNSVDSVVAKGNRVYATTGGDTTSPPTVYALDITDPKNPTLAGSLALEALTPADKVYDTALEGDRLLLGMSGGRAQVVEAKEGESLKLLGKVQIPSGGQAGIVSNVDLAGDWALLSVTGAGSGLYSKDITTLDDPEVKKIGYAGQAPVVAHDGAAVFVAAAGKIDVLESAGGSGAASKSYPVAADTLYPAGNTMYYLVTDNGTRRLAQFKLTVNPDGLACKTQFDAAWSNSCQPFKIAAGDILSADIMKRWVFFNNQNEDAIGIQVFSVANSNLQQWYLDKFETLGNMKSAAVAGYEALTDGNNYYVKALNFVTSTNPAEDDLYSNVYLFSLNPNAQKTTREVFKGILQSLAFNINLSDHGYCLNSGVSAAAPSDVDQLTLRQYPDLYGSTPCVSDFQCRDADGEPLSGTNGVCSNIKTKLQRDLFRLNQIGPALGNLDKYFAEKAGTGDFKADLKGGTYAPGYTVSRWPSWGLLGGLVKEGWPIDPLNQWTSCAASDAQTCWDAAQGLYLCPKFKSVYEYEYVSSTGQYVFHAPLEFFTKADQVTATYVSTSDRFSTEPWPGCAGTAYSPFGQKCGDGVINPGEQCDPAGTSAVSFEGKMLEQVGYCSAWPNKQCASGLADCGYHKVLSSGDHVYSPAKSVCADLTNGATNYLVNVGASAAAEKRYQLFGCHIAADCQETATYKGAAVKMGFGSAMEYSAADFVDKYLGTYIKNNPDKVGCLPLWADEQPQSCDLSTVPGPVGACPAGAAASKVCDSSCQWQYGLCQKTAQCGNGSVETGEKCDDGLNLNGQYGQCNSQCDGLSAAFCGNKSIDFNDKNGDGLKDADEPFIEFCEPALNGFAVGNYALKKEQSCAWDCQGYGGYCGDKVVQADKGEACDDGNTISFDGCSSWCKQENSACKKQEPLFTTSTVSTFFYLAKGPYQGIDGYLLNSGGSYIPECTQETTGDAICGAYGFSCTAVAKVIAKLNLEPHTCQESMTKIVGDNKQIIVSCQGVYSGPAVKPAVLTEPGVCGNGIKDAGEFCDDGANNNVACAAPYGGKCTYCKAGCKVAETVESLARCGNGVIDQSGENAVGQAIYEACDTAGAQVVSSTLSGAQVAVACTDKGVYECAGNCTLLVNKCVECGSFKKKPVAMLRTVNPILKSDVSLDKELTLLGHQDVEVSLVERITATGWGLLRTTNVYQDYIGKPFPDVYRPITDANTGYGLETNVQCQDEYRLAFNVTGVAAEHAGIDTVEQLAADDALDLFPYTVNGEFLPVKKDAIVSPAVPPGVFRVVIRWTGQEAAAGGEFQGLVYSESMTTAKDPLQKEKDAVDYFDYYQKNFICEGMSNMGWKGSNYWRPGAGATGQCAAVYGLYVHPRVDTGNTHIQSFTIDTTAAADDKPYAFFVQALDSLIVNYVDSNLTVEVYGYHPNQAPLHSIYLPAETFAIKSAQDTSTSPAVKYWHVFNLIKEGGEYKLERIEKKSTEQGQVTPDGTFANGTLETYFCQILDNIPGATACAL